MEQLEESLKGFKNWDDFLSYAKELFPELLPESYHIMYGKLLFLQRDDLYSPTETETMKKWKADLIAKWITMLPDQAEYDNMVYLVMDGNDPREIF